MYLQVLHKQLHSSYIKEKLFWTILIILYHLTELNG